MLGYLVRRLAMTIPTLLLVAITVFALVRLIPGDPVQVMLGDSADPAQVGRANRRDSRGPRNAAPATGCGLSPVAGVPCWRAPPRRNYSVLPWSSSAI